MASKTPSLRMAYNSWEQILTLGQAPVEQMGDVCRQSKRPRIKVKVKKP